MKLHSKPVRTGNNPAYQSRQMVRHTKAAVDAYQAMTNADPSRAISPARQREVREYARDHFGDAKHSPWLELFAGWSGEFVKGCVPETYLVQYIVPYSVQPHGDILDNTLSSRTLASDRFPDIGYVLKGTLYDRDFNHVDPATYAKQIFADHPYIYLKQATAFQGRGVARVNPGQFEAAIARSNTAVLQYPLEMHDDLVELSPSAAATLRISTISHQGETRAVGAYLRLGSVGDTHIISKSAFKITADLKSGKLFEFGTNKDWVPLSAHPDTGIPFFGTEIPHFQDAVAAVEDHHARVPHISFIGWDVAITKSDGPMFFESNAGHTGHVTHEANQGPIFAGTGWDQLHLKA